MQLLAGRSVAWGSPRTARILVLAVYAVGVAGGIQRRSAGSCFASLRVAGLYAAVESGAQSGAPDLVVHAPDVATVQIDIVEQ